ncbi:MAG: hypothetical protein IE932_16695 [Sphingopyxis terrae]|nr:hypothetical protein [Sphingopyxis terrae]
MPDVATAPTADAAQTAAAGSRMMGFYLGGGGVKVDCLFDTANFLKKNGNTFEGVRSSDGDVLDVGKSGGQRLRVFTNADTIGLFNVAGSGAGRDGMRILDGAVAFDVNDVERGRVTTLGFEVNVPGGGKLLVGQAGSTSVKLSSTATMQYEVAAGSSHQFLVNGLQVAQIGPTNMTPGSDNGRTLGSASLRWSVVYAGTGTINTSDERFKIWIGRPGEDRAAKDRRIARAILDELGWYQFTDAVTEKGPDGARWHYGARAQRIWQIVADEGLAPPLVDVGGVLLPDISWAGPVAPAWLCFDGWNDQFEDVYREVVHVDEVQVGEEATGEFDPDGAEIMRPVTEEVERIEREPTGERQLVRAAGHLFGFRVDEMNLLLSWALHDRLSALEAAA